MQLHLAARYIASYLEAAEQIFDIQPIVTASIYSFKIKIMDQASFAVNPKTVATVTSAAKSIDFKSLQSFSAKVKMLIVSATEDIWRVIKTIGELDKINIIGTGAPTTMSEIEQLKLALKELVIVCKRFVNAAKNLAQYAVNEEMLSAIERELSAYWPTTDTLSMWLDGVENRFKCCSMRAANFIQDYEKVVADVKKKADTQQHERDENIRVLQETQDCARNASGASIAIGAVGAVVSAGAGIGACVATGGLAAPLAVVFFAAATGTVTGATAAGTISAKYYAAAKFSEAQLQLLDSTIKTVNRLHVTINTLKTDQGKLDGCISDAKDSVEILKQEVDTGKVKNHVPSLKNNLSITKSDMQAVFEHCNSTDWDKYL